MLTLSRIAAKHETKRLKLRPFKRSDAANLPGLLNDWDVSRWLSRAPFPYTLQDGKGWIRLSRSIVRRGQGLALAIVRKEDDDSVAGQDDRIKQPKEDPQVVPCCPN